MEETKLFQELAKRVQELNTTIAEARDKGLIVRVCDHSGTGTIDNKILQVIVTKPVFDTNQD